MRTYFPVSSNIKPLGRTMERENALWLCYSATGAAFQFHGKQLSVTLLGDDRCENDGMAGNLARVKVWVDGVIVNDLMVNQKEIKFSLVNEQEAKIHQITIMKVSESAMSTCGIGMIETDDEGSILPVETKQRFIEFAGDSITCGYGVDDEVAEHNFKTDTEDATKAYAYLTCQHLQADHSLVSLSGYGIISGYSDDGVRRPDQRLPLFYEKLGFSYGNFQGVYPQDVAWDFIKRQPDLVVVNLGTNDDSFTRDDAALQQEYCDTYQSFLKTIRQNNPTAKILCILGIMGERLNPMVEKAVADYQKDTGDTNVHFAPFTEQLPEDGRAADWHPSQLTHRKNAEKLSAIIKNLMNW